MYPLAIQVGMTKSEFFHSTFKDVMIRIEAFEKNEKKEIKEIEFLAWLTGMYVTHSISCCFTKNGKYPENPLKVDTKDVKQVAKITGKSEEELLQEEAYMSLMVKKANANIAESRKKRKELQGK